MKRVFLDSNVLIDGIVAHWSVSRAVLILCARRVHQLVLSDYVRLEVEDALLDLAVSRKFDKRQAERMIEDYLRFIESAMPRLIAVAPHEPEMAYARIIHHLHDVPVLAAALKARPDWVLSLNRKHFSPQLAARTGLQIVDPLQFFQAFHT